MKVYSIGRELGCDIIINDNTDVISRRHATLNVLPSGKMTIIDLSHNGTYVNGIRINQNVPVPVTREDNISFAHVAQLDWNQIPDTRGTVIKYALIGLFAILLVIGGIWGYSSLGGGNSTSSDENTPAVTDTLDLKQKEEKMRETEQQKMDSIKKHVQDSLTKARKKGNEAQKSKKSAVKKTEPKKETPKKEEPKQKRFH